MNLYNPRTAAPRLYNLLTKQFGIAPQRVNVLCRTGRLGIQAGKSWVITEEEIDRFNEARQAPPQETE
jgi:hypothetical protein